MINIQTQDATIEDEVIQTMKAFLEKIVTSGQETIAYVQKYWKNYMANREQFEIAFDTLEKIITNEINIRYNLPSDEKYNCSALKQYSINKILNILELTSQKKRLIKRNINLNLLLDRYIIEVTKG